MPFYPNTETLYSVMTDLFGRMMAAPEMAQSLRESRAVLCIKTGAPEAVLLLDTRGLPPRFVTGQACAGEVDLGLWLAADTLHAIWLGRVQMRDAFAAGQIKLETNPLRALALLGKFEGMFRYAERLYPTVLRDQGLA